MGQIVYTSVRCLRCGKTSAIPFARTELAAFLDEQVPIELMCVYDQYSWVASAAERVGLARLLVDTARR